MNKPLTIARIASCIVGALTLCFLWWLSGTDFPSKRGPDAVLFFVEVILFTFLGYSLFHVIFHNWYWKRRND